MLNYPQTIPGIDEQRVSASAAAVFGLLAAESVPDGFPIEIWGQMQSRYNEYWRWFRGDVFNEQDGVDDQGNPLYLYPLAINAVRDFARKHTAILFGEAPDSPVPMVKTAVTPRMPMNGDEFSEDDAKTALFLENVINEVWRSSHGRALQVEAATLSQVLGGCVFQTCWTPWEAEEKVVPITIKQWPADFILPIWNSDNPWDLLECFLVYRIGQREAELRYGAKNTSIFNYYVEHWTKDKYSIYINRTPITMNVMGTVTTFKNVDNPFGFVPFVYIPHLREGNFYGSSLVEDVRGLIKEVNSTTADISDAIKDTVDRKRYLTNSISTPTLETLADGTEMINLGVTPPNQDRPEVDTEDPPTMSEGMANHDVKIWQQALRMGHMSNSNYGEDEGSQRSALTLAFRMWPSTSHSKMERTYWESGGEQIGTYILKMCVIKSILVDNTSVPPDFQKRFQLSMDWFPQIPRDREQMVNEAVIRKSSGLASTRKALQMLGDVRNIDAELKEIKADKEFEASLQVKQAADTMKAKTDIQTPVASDGLRE